MTQEEANGYALRMFNDDAWDKTYTPDTNGLQIIRNADQSATVVLPVVLKTERTYVCDDDSVEYADRPDAVDNDLAQDDQGVITIPFELSFDYPADYVRAENKDSFAVLQDLGIMISKIGNATLYDGELQLSQTAQDRLIECISESYMVLDTFHQNAGLANLLLS